MKYILSFIVAIASLAGCKKEKVTELPAATQTGANTFGARVNGVLWIPQGFGVAPTTPLLEASYGVNRTSITINARNFAHEPKESEFKLFLRNVKTTGTYLLDGRTGNEGYYEERQIVPTGAWETNSTKTGRVDITRADTVNHIYSGTFAFEAASLDGEEAIKVTEGRFDVKVNF